MKRTTLRQLLGPLPLTGSVLAALATGSVALAATPVSGFISGQIVSVKGTSFVVKNSFGTVGDSTVSLTGSSLLVKQSSATRSDLKTGVCVTATGQKATSGTVDALRITIAPAVKGKCASGFFGHRGSYPHSGTGSTGSPPANFTGFGNFGFAAGEITAVKGDTLTIHGQNGTTTATLTSATNILATQKVTSSAIAVNECASVRGTSADNGVTVKATNVNLSEPGQTGCNHGFPSHT